jgi:hypothetical protein
MPRILLCGVRERAHLSHLLLRACAPGYGAWSKSVALAGEQEKAEEVER